MTCMAWRIYRHSFISQKFLFSFWPRQSIIRSQHKIPWNFDHDNLEDSTELLQNRIVEHA